MLNLPNLTTDDTADLIDEEEGLGIKCRLHRCFCGKYRLLVILLLLLLVIGVSVALGVVFSQKMSTGTRSTRSKSAVEHSSTPPLLSKTSTASTPATSTTPSINSKPDHSPTVNRYLTPSQASSPVSSASSICNTTRYYNISQDDLSRSHILGSLERKFLYKLRCYLDPVLQSPSRSRFVRCWHAKTDGWAASTFHTNCDGKGPTVTIIKVGTYIFGGYTDLTWFSPSCNYAPSNKTFIYSLYNINGYSPVKLEIKSGQTIQAIVRCSHYGPTFGAGYDIFINDNAASYQASYTYCGFTYSLPPGYSSTGIHCKFYAGSYNFIPTDVEVFFETTI